MFGSILRPGSCSLLTVREGRATVENVGAIGARLSLKGAAVWLVVIAALALAGSLEVAVEPAQAAGVRNCVIILTESGRPDFEQDRKNLETRANALGLGNVVMGNPKFMARAIADLRKGRIANGASASSPFLPLPPQASRHSRVRGPSRQGRGQLSSIPITAARTDTQPFTSAASPRGTADGR
jgi:hypothetical protein